MCNDDEAWSLELRYRCPSGMESLEITVFVGYNLLLW